MVYEYNRSQIVAKEESFHKNLDENEMTVQSQAQKDDDAVEIQSYTEREPSMRASELKSDFRTGRSSALITKNPSMSSSIVQDTVYSKEESFTKMTPKNSTLDKNALKMEF